MQYRNIDLSGPEQVRITWHMETPRDDSSDRPDERQDGYWPSLDRNEAGFVGDGVTIEEFGKMQEEARERMRAWENDEWEYVGVVAVAVVAIPIGSRAYTIHTMRSAGLWGIESDSGEYLKEVYEEEKSALYDQLTTLGAALASNGALITDKDA